MTSLDICWLLWKSWEIGHCHQYTDLCLLAVCFHIDIDSWKPCHSASLHHISVCCSFSYTCFRHKMIELYMQLSTTKFFNLFSPPRFSGRTPAPVCQGALQLRWQGTRRPQIQQGWHYHPASTSGWELVPRWDGWSPRLFPHQLCPSY